MEYEERVTELEHLLNRHLAILNSFIPNPNKVENLLEMNLKVDKQLQFYLTASSISQKLVEAVKQEINQALDGHDISYRHWVVLKVIYFQEANTPSNIADLISADKPTVTRITDHLVSHSLLERHRGVDDRRTIQLQLTDLGKHQVMAGMVAFKKVPKLFKARLTSKEAKNVSCLESGFLTNSQ